jgi:hypothetical protein
MKTLVAMVANSAGFRLVAGPTYDKIRDVKVGPVKSLANAG